LCRPEGLLAEGLERRAESFFPICNEGFTLPSLSLFRPDGLLAEG
jgi:hypothetical protein